MICFKYLIMCWPFFNKKMNVLVVTCGSSDPFLNGGSEGVYKSFSIYFQMYSLNKLGRVFSYDNEFFPILQN